MSSEPLEVEMEERTRRIVETAIELAEKGGFEAVRLRDVAAHAEVALGTLYRRFRSKDDLLVAALEMETRALDERVRQRPPLGADAAERLGNFFAVASRGMIRRPNLSRAMLRAAASGEPALAKRVANFHSRLQRMVIGALRGSPVDEKSPVYTEREELVGDVLQHVWFSLMVGWSGGQHTPAAIQEKMRASVKILLEGAGEEE